MIAIIFATLEEARPFIHVTGATPADEDPSLYRIDRPVFHKPAMIHICGMGTERAAESIHYVCGSLEAATIINAGICGAAAKGPQIGDVFMISQTCDYDHSPPDSAIYPCAWKHVNGLPVARLATSNTPVFDHDVKMKMAEWGELVDMEGAAIARECGIKAIPCWMIKGVSDLADEHGKSSIKKHLGPVSKKIASVLFSFMREELP